MCARLLRQFAVVHDPAPTWTRLRPWTALRRCLHPTSESRKLRRFLTTPDDAPPYAFCDLYGLTMATLDHSNEELRSAAQAAFESTRDFYQAVARLVADGWSERPAARAVAAIQRKSPDRHLATH